MIGAPAPPTAKELFSALPPERLRRSSAKGIAIFLGATTLWASFLAVVVLAESLLLKAAASLGVGIWLAVLFVVGHDACHGSLTPHPRLNRVIGRLAFIHSFHPYTSWKHSHNGLHHGWTNVRGRDVVFVPYSKSEYDHLPRWRRWAERWFRSPVGLPFFYLCTIWLPFELFPNAYRAPRGADRRSFRIDRMLVLAYLAMFISGLWAFAVATQQSVSALLLLGLLMPQMAFHAAMSFVSYVHHTHVRAPWYASADDYVYFNSQVRSTVHSEFPAPIEYILHRILDHTAHHTDPRVPLYNLRLTQATLERLYPHEVIHEPWSLRNFLRTLRTCRLYDYDSHRWLDWDGTPLTAPLLPRRSSLGDQSVTHAQSSASDAPV